MSSRKCEPLLSRTDCKLLQSKFPNTWNMTSREFHTDTHARADFIAYHLKDITTKIFEEAIRYNRHLFKGKTILVLNSGFDLLFSLWAVKYGAAHVYAVDVSNAVDYLKAIVDANNLNERITIIHGRIQDIQLPVKEVDVILSNWMGYALLIESRIKNLIFARDKWLNKTEGIIFPDVGELFVVGIQNSENKNRRIDWWVDVHSFNMNAIRKISISEPIFQKVNPNEVLTMPVRVWKIDLNKIKSDELHFKDTFYIDMLKSGRLEGLLAYFDIHFSKSHVPVQFSTSPWAPYTNWLQTVFYFNHPIAVNDRERYYCGISMNNMQLKDGSHVTKTALKIFSGIEKNLNLLYAMKWSIKSPFTVHDDIPNGNENQLNGYNSSNEKSSNSNGSSELKNSLKKPFSYNDSPLFHEINIKKNMPTTMASENLSVFNNNRIESKSLLLLGANQQNPPSQNLSKINANFDNSAFSSIPMQLNGQTKKFKNKNIELDSNLFNTKLLKHPWNNLENKFQRKFNKKEPKQNETLINKSIINNTKSKNNLESPNLTFKMPDSNQKHNQVKFNFSNKKLEIFTPISNINSHNSSNILKNENQVNRKQRKLKLNLHQNVNQIKEESISNGAIPKTNHLQNLPISTDVQLQSQKQIINKKKKNYKNVASTVNI